MNEEINTTTAQSGMPKTIYQDMTPEERLTKLRESADQVENHSYCKPYTDEKISEIRAEISDLCIKISDYERELSAVKAQYKSLITPLENDREALVSDLRSGGVFVDEECFVFLNFNIGKAGLYTKDGVLLKEKDITPEMGQSTIFQMLRDNPDEQDNDEPEVPLLEAEPYYRR